MPSPRLMDRRFPSHLSAPGSRGGIWVEDAHIFLGLRTPEHPPPCLETYGYACKPGQPYVSAVKLPHDYFFLEYWTLSVRQTLHADYYATVCVEEHMTCSTGSTSSWLAYI